MQSGSEAFEVVYYVIPYTRVPTMLPFTVDIYSDVQVDCSPVTMGIQALYHRHRVGEYDPQWQHDAVANEFVAACFYAAEFDSELTWMREALAKLLGLLSQQDCVDDELVVSRALKLIQNAASKPYNREVFVAEVVASYDVLNEALDNRVMFREGCDEENLLAQVTDILGLVCESMEMEIGFEEERIGCDVCGRSIEYVTEAFGVCVECDLNMCNECSELPVPRKLPGEKACSHAVEILAVGIQCDACGRDIPDIESFAVCKDCDLQFCGDCSLLPVPRQLSMRDAATCSHTLAAVQTDEIQGAVDDEAYGLWDELSELELPFMKMLSILSRREVTEGEVSAVVALEYLFDAPTRLKQKEMTMEEFVLEVRSAYSDVQEACLDLTTLFTAAEFEGEAALLAEVLAGLEQLCERADKESAEAVGSESSVDNETTTAEDADTRHEIVAVLEGALGGAPAVKLLLAEGEYIQECIDALYDLKAEAMKARLGLGSG